MNTDTLTMYGFLDGDRVWDTSSTATGTVRITLATAEDLTDGLDPIMGEVQWDRPIVDANAEESMILFAFADDLEMCAATLALVFTEGQRVYDTATGETGEITLVDLPAKYRRHGENGIVPTVIWDGDFSETSVLVLTEMRRRVLPLDRHPLAGREVFGFTHGHRVMDTAEGIAGTIYLDAAETGAGVTAHLTYDHGADQAAGHPAVNVPLTATLAADLRPQNTGAPTESHTTDQQTD